MQGFTKQPAFVSDLRLTVEVRGAKKPGNFCETRLY